MSPVTFCSATLSHIGKVRKLNEDAYLERPDLGLWVVADGMGGHSAGNVASQLIVNTLNKLVKPQQTLAAFISTIEEGLQAVNQELVAMGRERHQIIGSTVVALLVHGQQCAYLWAGDSRAYLFREGALTQLSSDHSQVELYVQLGILTREEAVTHPSSNLILRAIGAEEHLSVESKLLDLQPNDRYLLCSDGLYKHVGDAELAQFLSLGSAAQVARALVDAALAGGGSDNVTVSIIDIRPSSTEGYAAEESTYNDDLELTIPDLTPPSPGA
jgi:serine/threonine protein phosphatase Stp1